jgi:MFS family permease
MIRRPATILALLTGLNLLNYLDRLVLSAVLPKVRDELGLSSFEGGLLATVFLLGYFVTSPVFGALGDRLPRKGLIALGIVVWSAATIGSGVATSLASLIAARAVVGVGEASYATLAPTIIDDITPPHKKGRALGIFYVATPIGAALGYLVGGFVEHRWGWRHAFYVAGGPGLVLAIVCMFIEEPKRRMSADKPDIKRDLGALVKLPLYRFGVLGYCAYTAAVGAFSYWAPEFLFRRYGLDLAVANFRFGIVTIVAGALATWIGGRWADRQRLRVERDAAPEDVERETIRGLLRICATGSVIGVPAAAACFLSPSPNIFFVCVFLCILALFLSTSPINAVILKSVPEELRASAMALCIFGIHLLGDLWSPPFVGLLMDHLPLQVAMMVLPIMIAVSAWLWWPAGATGPRNSTVRQPF